MPTAPSLTLLRFPFADGLELRLRPGLDIATPEGFRTLCDDNPQMRLERNRRGELTIEMPPQGSTGARNSLLAVQIGVWALSQGEGLAFDSSAGFALPDGSTLSPDAAWLRKERLSALTSEQKQGFLPLAPDFVVELRSRSDRLAHLTEKMADWIANGVRLGVLLDPEARRVHVYRPGSAAQVLDDPATLDCSPELPGLTLDIRALFDLSL